MTRADLPDSLRRLPELARNLWWSWQPEARALFKRLDEALWRRTRHNPLRVLAEIAPARLEEAGRDPEYLGRYGAVLAAFDRAMVGAGSWTAARHPGLAGQLVAYFSAEYGVGRERFLALGAGPGGWAPGFNMTALALRLSGRTNAVSRRHGEESRRMWWALWPEAASEAAVPIVSVTNGIHVPSWIATEMDGLFRRHLGEDWATRHDDPALWTRLAEIPDAAASPAASRRTSGLP